MNGESLPLETLDISRSCRDFLRVQGLSTVEELLSCPPQQIARRARFAAEVRSALILLEKRCPAQREQLAAYREALSAAAEEPRRQTPRAPVTPVEHALAALEQRGQPMVFRQLRDQVKQASGATNLSTLRRDLQQTDAVVFYPYGAHDWTGLRAWGPAGYRAAAEGAWPILPVHLERLTAQGGQLDTQSHAVLQQLAHERGHELLGPLLAALAPGQAVVAEPAEAPAERVAEPLPVAWATDLFRGLEFDAPPARLAAPLVRRARRWGKGPFSLCQLRVSGQDVGWLRSWAARLRSGRLEHFLAMTTPAAEVEGRLCSPRECLGLLVLLLASEVARREAREGQVWNVVHPLFSEKARELLFAQGQPRSVLRQALEAACRRFGLHHAFGIEGAQSWYQTIFFQFGFTRKGLAKLPLWLTVEETHSVAIHYLRKHSPEFAALWQALWDYRRHRSPQTAEPLEGCPFLLPEWVPEVSRAALEAVPDSGVAVVMEDTAYPRLHWPPDDQPLFVIQTATLFDELSEATYSLIQDDEPVARICLDAEGYLGDPPELRLRPRQERAHFTLVGDDGEDVRELEAELWDPDALYGLYSLPSGERLPEVVLGRSCALLCSADVEIQPAPSRSVPCGSTGYRLHRFDKGLTKEHRLTLGEQELTGLATERTPSWAEEVRLVCRQQGAVPLPSRVTVDLMVPAGVTLRWARFGRQTIPTSPTLGGYRGHVFLEPEITSENLRMHFGLERDGVKLRLSRSCPVAIEAVTSWLEGAWRVLKVHPRLLVREARDGSFRFFTGGQPHREFALLEGDVFSTRPRRGTRSLGRLAGLGAPLRIRQGPFNAENEGEILALEVRDPGLLADLRRREGRFDLRLCGRLEADEHHVLVWWDGREEPTLQWAEELEVAEGEVWSGPLPPEADGAVAMGLGYSGARLGLWWTEGEFLPGEDPPRPAETAGMLRWLHAPILRSDWLPRVRTAAWKNPEEFLKAWLVSSHVDRYQELQFPAELSEWFSAVREVFRGWRPADAQAAARIFEAVPHEALLRASPLVLVRVAVEACTDHERKQLQLVLADCPNPGRFEACLGQLEEQAARDMRVHHNFVAGLVRRIRKLWSGKGRALGDRERLNFGLACEVAPFRRLLAARLLG